MSVIRASVDEQIMTITNNPLLASGSANTNKLMITFDSEWEGYLKTAVFYQDIKKPYFAIMENDSCIVPWEVLENDGILCMGVFGVKENSRITTVINKYKVFKGALTSEMGLQPPTMDVWQQIFSELLSIKLLAEQIKKEQTDFVSGQNKDREEYQSRLDKQMSDYKANTTQEIKNTLEKYGDLVVLMDINDYVEVPQRKSGSVYFNATERVDQSLQKVIVMKENGYIPPPQRQEENLYFNTETTQNDTGGIKASPYVGLRII